jgi:hypothetical protein
MRGSCAAFRLLCLAIHSAIDASVTRLWIMQLTPQSSFLRDPAWLDAYRAAAAILRPSDVLLAPSGSWPSFPCPARFYQGPFELGDATTLLLHKGRLASLPKPVLSDIMARWTCTHANEVFVLLSATIAKSSRLPSLRRWVYLRSVRRYLKSRQLKRRDGAIYFVHIPKTAGTSLWNSLRRAYPSNVYYPDYESWQANPPAAGDYDLVGLHFPISTVAPTLREEDVALTLLRDPTKRFFSTLAHARRRSEDPQTFTPAMQAMRAMSAAEFLATEDGRLEARRQLVLLGSDHRLPFYRFADAEMMKNALALLERPNVMFAPSDSADRFLAELAAKLGFHPRALPRNNATTAETYAEFTEEFREAAPLVEYENAVERALYKQISDRGEARRAPRASVSSRADRMAA